MVNRLRIVIDTNVLLVAISSKSKYHWVFEKLLNSHSHLLVANDKHFDVVKNLDFPSIKVVSIKEFENLLHT